MSEAPEQRPTNRLRSVVRWLVVIAVFLAATEIFVRVDDALTWDAPVLGPYTNERLLLQDSLGFRGRPNYAYQKWRMNNAGFRGPDISISPPAGLTRIVVTGASETFGLHESPGAEYPAQMQVILDSIAPRRFEVINAALPGMSLLALESYFHRAIAPVQPDLLVVYLSPAFYLFPRALSVEYTPPRLPPAQRWNVGPWEGEGELFQSRFAAKTRDVLKQLVPLFAVTKAREWKLERQRSVHPPEWLWREVPADRMETMRIHLERFVKSAQRTGVKVVFVTHTNRFIGAPQDTLKADGRHLTNVMSLYYPQATPHVLISVDSVANELLRQVAREQGAAVVEVEGKIPPTAEQFADYLHFTDTGARTMARILASEMVRIGSDSLHAPVTSRPVRP